MTKTLILMRHAKSSWDDLNVGDHERPLNTRGRRSAAALGQWLKGQGLLPDEVLSSSSRRTQETFEGLSLETIPTYTRALYHAGPAQMLGVLREAQGQCVLMLGHNPGIARFADQLVQKRPAHDRFADYPSGATTVMTFESSMWGNLQFGTGAVTQFIIPRELAEF